MARSWRDWLSIRRLIPLLLIVGAVATVIADAIGRLPTHSFERVMVLLLALLALDSLVERIGLLERIHDLLRKRRMELNDRSTVVANDTIFAEARDVTISGVTLLNVLTDREYLFQSLLAQGARMRVLLLNPMSARGLSGTKLQTTRQTKPISMPPWPCCAECAGNVRSRSSRFVSLHICCRPVS